MSGLYRGHLCDDCGKGYDTPLTADEVQFLLEEGYYYKPTLSLWGDGIRAARVEIHRIKCVRSTRFERGEVV